MAKQLLVLMVACVIWIVPQDAFAWGRVGHATVADIAESRLTPQALKTVKELLSVEHDQHLSDIASWADQIKEEHRPGSPAHSIRLPLDHNDTIDPTLCPSHYCVVQGINDYYKQLADKGLPLEQREIALKYLVHLVGDIHQPLHASVATGGNVAVAGEGRIANLHGVWDDSIIYSQGRNPEAIATRLEAKIDKGGLFFGGDAATWALESRAIARDVIYKTLPTESKEPLTLPANYDEMMWPIVEARLTQAGVRLADLLNSALG